MPSQVGEAEEQSQVSARVDASVKEKASDIFEKLGLTTSGAINMFLRQVILQNGIPFDVKLELTERSQRSLKELQEGEGTEYDNPEEMFDDLGI
ncbi:MAG: type II toxin-antitoxin system RelB/DinJ family antitoxin [bacterium]